MKRTFLTASILVLSATGLADHTGKASFSLKQTTHTSDELAIAPNATNDLVRDVVDSAINSKVAIQTQDGAISADTALEGFSLMEAGSTDRNHPTFCNLFLGSSEIICSATYKDAEDSKHLQVDFTFDTNSKLVSNFRTSRY